MLELIASEPTTTAAHFVSPHAGSMQGIIPRSIIRVKAKGGIAEQPLARDWVVATNVAFIPAIIACFANGWTLVAWHTVFVTVASFLYHLDLESARFAMLDQVLATLLFFHVVAFACEVGCWPVGVCTIVGMAAWKLGHKCHCSDKAACGHAYDPLPATMHGAMHLIAATGATSLGMMSSTSSIVPFGSMFIL